MITDDAITMVIPEPIIILFRRMLRGKLGSNLLVTLLIFFSVALDANSALGASNSVSWAQFQACAKVIDFRFQRFEKKTVHKDINTL